MRVLRLGPVDSVLLAQDASRCVRTRLRTTWAEHRGRKEAVGGAADSAVPLGWSSCVDELRYLMRRHQSRGATVDTASAAVEAEGIAALLLPHHGADPAVLRVAEPKDRTFHCLAPTSQVYRDTDYKLEE